ncbi:ATP-binding protein [Halotia wernerae UHCC 0503]|nr:ATP-binding protein [Halotia wernerae UHCC 0503]
MNVDELSQQIEKLRSRVTILLQCAATETNSPQNPTAEAFEELQIALEELKIACEELEATRAIVEKERQRYQELFDFAPDGYLMTDIYGNILEANRAAALLLNISQRFLIGKPLVTYIAQSDYQAYFAHLNQLQQFDQDIEWEVLLKPRAQAPFYVALRVVNVRNQQGDLVALRWLMRDITKRKHLESEREELIIRERAGRVAAILAATRSNLLAEASYVMASSLDYYTTLTKVAQLTVTTLADWCIVDVIENHLLPFSNPIVAASDPQQEALVREIRRCYPIAVDADFGLAEVLRTGESELVSEISESLLLKTAHNEEHLSLLRQLQTKSYMVVPLLVHERKLGTIVFASAQPGRKYTKADLAMVEELAQRAALAIDNTRLYQEAQEANRIKDEFLATISHELRTPLNSILGWIQIIGRGKLDEATTSKALETIERNAKLQMKLVEDILDVSRIIKGHVRLNIRKINLVSVINAVIEAVLPTAEIKAIQIESHFDPLLGEVMGDAERLQQVVWNLLSNAIKFTPSGGRVEVHLEQVKSNAQITISDTGKGISAEFLPYIFERFRQADSTITRTESGLGLGLTIVRHLVEMHSGTVYAVSPGEGQGATFTVELPIVELQPEQLTGEIEVKVNNLLMLDGLQILFVDDNDDTRELITFILEQQGAQVTAVSSVSEALVELAKLKPNVLISDIGMPDEDGYSLIRKVRSQEAGKEDKIPAIALTAFARNEERQLALEAGFQAHLTKPIEPDELVIAVANLTEPNK